jgi:hypothetical protein
MFFLMAKLDPTWSQFGLFLLVAPLVEWTFWGVLFDGVRTLLWRVRNAA